MGDSEKLAKAIATSTIFDGLVDVYQLEDARILLSNRGAVRALTGKSGAAERTSLGRFLERLPSDYANLAAPPDVRFIMPQGGIADGISPESLLAIMRAYSESFDLGLLHSSQEHLAKNCNRILRALSEVGLVKLCEEALGIVRPNADLLFREALFREKIATDAIWPDRLVVQYCHWHAIKWHVGDIHPYSMQSLNGFFYEMIFADDIRRLIQQRGLDYASTHHGTLRDPLRDYVRAQLQVATAIALNSGNEPHWRRKMRLYYQKGTEPTRRRHVELANPEQVRLF